MMLELPKSRVLLGGACVHFCNTQHHFLLVEISWHLRAHECNAHAQTLKQLHCVGVLLQCFTCSGTAKTHSSTPLSSRHAFLKSSVAATAEPMQGVEPLAGVPRPTPRVVPPLVPRLLPHLSPRQTKPWQEQHFVNFQTTHGFDPAGTRAGHLRGHLYPPSHKPMCLIIGWRQHNCEPVIHMGRIVVSRKVGRSHGKATLMYLWQISIFVNTTCPQPAQWKCCRIIGRTSLPEFYGPPGHTRTSC